MLAGRPDLSGGRLAGVLVLVFCGGLLGCSRSESAAAIELEIFDDGYPRALIFRQAEVLANRLSYPDWERQMLELDGVVSKAVPELLDWVTSRNLDYLRRFKARHPEKLVLLHFDGVALRSEFAPEFASPHWLYRAGSVLAADIAAEAVELPVARTAPFEAETGRFRDRGDDIVIVALDEGGGLDWSRVEHARVLGVDAQRSTLKVERGISTSQARSFRAGSRVAPHVNFGPFCDGCEMLWALNRALDAPGGGELPTARELFAELLIREMGAGGRLESFDGVQLDGFPFVPRGGRRADVDFDGRADGGDIGGRPSFGLGGLEALARLRRGIGAGRILSIDGGAPQQRADFDVVSGLELESFSGNLRSSSLAQWTSRLNLLAYAQAHSHAPALTYVNHKYAPEIAFPIDYANHRMVLAATQFSDTVFTFFIEPGGGSLTGLGDRVPNEIGESARTVRIFDELIQGAEAQPNWLGLPVGPTQHLATERPDLLEGAGLTLENGFLARLSSASGDVTWSRVDEATPALRVESSTGEEIAFSLAVGEAQGEDLFVSVEFRAEPLTGFPPGVARQVRVRVGEAEATGLTGGRWFRSYFYLRGIEAGPLEVRVSVEGHEPVLLRRLAIHQGPDLVLREFQRGLVLANPSLQPQSVGLDDRFPTATFSRLRATTGQDASVNDGSRIEGVLTLPAEDALFLVREPPPSEAL